MRFKRIIAFVLLLFILAVNALPGSSVQSTKVLAFYRTSANILSVFSSGAILLGTANLFIRGDPVTEDLDKLLHFTFYFILSCAFFGSVTGHTVSLGFLSYFSLVDELHQIPVSGRSFSPGDIFFDLLGIALVFTMAGSDEKH